MDKHERDHPGPLRGLRVVEFGGIGPGPFAAMLLADLGADVVRVDRESSMEEIDDGRSIVNRGKRSIVLDLKSRDGAEIGRSLIEQADVLIESSRPGVMERLGLGPDAVLNRNPRLIYGRMTGWGQHGPKSMTAGHDLGYIAGTGLLNAIGEADHPTVPLNLIGDYAGGSLYLVIGILAALREVQSTGSGQVVDAAIVDGAVHLATLFHGMLHAGGWKDQRASNLLDGGAPFYRIYETADHKHLAVGPIEPHFYEQFTELLGLPADAQKQYDQTSWPELQAILSGTIATRTRAEWTDIFRGTDACVEPVLTFEESYEDEHLTARGTYVNVGGWRQPAPAPRFSRTPGEVTHVAPFVGQDTDEVLRDWGIVQESTLK